MGRQLALSLVWLGIVGASTSAGASTYECAQLRWKTPEDLAAFLTDRGHQGWQLVSFPKASRMCLKKVGKTTVYKCLRYPWRDEVDLSDFLNEAASTGWHLAAFAKPATLCLSRQSGAAANPTAKAKSTPKATASPSNPPSQGHTHSQTPQPSPAPGKSKNESVRDRAEAAHKKLSDEERKAKDQ